MANTIIQELESAALIILAPPNVVTYEQRMSGERVFLNFRNSKSPYNLCRQILENSTVDFVLFETAALLKDALIREWSTLQETDIISLRQYLLQYIMHPNVPVFVRERILQVIAIMVKRGSVDDFGRERAQILIEVEGLITSGDYFKQTLGCGLLAALMQEYAITFKSADVGLPWEAHFKAKKNFEVVDLPRIFKFCVRALSELLQNDPPYQENVISLTKYLLSITETILTWGYMSPLLPRRLIEMFEALHEADQSPALRLGLAWKDIILDHSLTALFFTIYWKVRENEQLAHHSMICLVQLATLCGCVVETDDAKLKYITGYIEAFLKLIDSIQIKDRESLGISNVIRKMVLLYQPKILCSLPENQLRSLLTHIAKLTCRFAEGAAHEESLYADDRIYMEAFDNILEAWATILHQNHSFPQELIEQLCIQMFNTYLQSHLSAPDGTRGSRELDTEEIDEIEETDRLKFRDQLKTIGTFGREITSYTLPLLSRLIEQRIDKLQAYLERIHRQSLNISDGASLDCVFEDLHWLILIAGHVICIDSDGETALIPREIMRFCIDQTKNGKVNTDLSLKLLASPHRNASTVSDAHDFIDPVIRLISAVFRLCEVEKSAAEAKMQHSLSPEVGSTVVWFLKRFALSYLIPNEGYYYEMSSLLLTAFGKESEGAKWTVNFLLSKVHSNIINFLSEMTLLTDSVQLLVSLVEKGGEKGCIVAKSEGLWQLVEIQSSFEPGALPQAARRGLFRAFVLAASSLDVTSRSEYLQQIISPTMLRFKHMISQDNFSRVYQLENIKIALIDILESFIGVSLGSHVSTVKIIFQMLTPVLSELASLLSVYHNYQIVVQLILELFCECARRMLCYLSTADSRRMYECCFATVQAYAQCNANRLTLEATAEEGNFQDILLVLELLTNISAKDCIDFSNDPTPDENSIGASDVCVYGLNFIMPLMTVELLKYPPLCTQYYKMITFINEFYPKKVCQLSNDLLEKLLGSVELGLTHFGPDIVTWSLEFIQLLATNIYKQGLQGATVYQMLMPFLKLLMNLILTRQFSSDLMSNTSVALYALISTYPEQYKDLVQTLIDSQTDSVVAERLASAFTELMNGITFNCQRIPRAKFKLKFDRFIVDVYGFLITK